MQMLTMLLAGLLLFSCSSAKKKEMAKVEDVDVSENMKKDFYVRDASSNLRPGWIVDAGVWAEKMEYNTEKFKYFSFETEPKVSREMACNLAKANARGDIAGEITTFIQKKLSSTTEGVGGIDSNNPMFTPLQSYVENSLTERVEAIITGASIEKSYWEKREYKKDLGARSDYFGYTCAVMAKVDKEMIKKSIDQVRLDMLNRSKDKGIRAKVEKALENADESFMKLRGI